MQLVNLICWLVPCAAVLAKLHNPAKMCHWFGNITNVCGVIRWTCWNTVVWMFHAGKMRYMFYKCSKSCLAGMVCRRGLILRTSFLMTCLHAKESLSKCWLITPAMQSLQTRGKQEKSTSHRLLWHSYLRSIN